MRNNYLSVMMDAAEVCFDTVNHMGVDKYTPHKELLAALVPLFSTPTIRFHEGYDAFVVSLSTKNEALDSWCKLIAVFISRLGEDYKREVREVFTDLFNHFGEISPALSSHFVVSGEPNVSRVLSYMLCLVASTKQGG